MVFLEKAKVLPGLPGAAPVLAGPDRLSPPAGH